MEIKETSKYGLANTIDRTIYLHPILNEYPETKKKIIHHELAHSKSSGFWENRKIDALTNLTFKELLPIYKRKPSLFLKQHSPILYIDKTWFIEWTIIFLILFYVSIIALIIWLISIFSNDLIFSYKVIQYMFLIGTGIFALYILGKKLTEYVNEEAKKEVTKK